MTTIHTTTTDAYVAIQRSTIERLRIEAQAISDAAEAFETTQREKSSATSALAPWETARRFLDNHAEALNLAAARLELAVEEIEAKQQERIDANLAALEVEAARRAGHPADG